MMMLHIGNKNYSSWSLRPWVLMKELGIPFEESMHWFTQGSQWDAFRSFAPNGRVPCLVDTHGGESTTVWDSFAIVEYLAERHPDVWPRDAAARTWARCATAEMHAGFAALRADCSMNLSCRYEMHTISESLARDIARVDELWQQGLARFGGPLLAGRSFTAVDAFYAPVVLRAQSYGLTLSDASRGYVTRMLARAALREWIDAGLVEPPEPAHEADCLVAARLVSDLRRPG